MRTPALGGSQNSSTLYPNPGGQRSLWIIASKAWGGRTCILPSDLWPPGSLWCLMVLRSVSPLPSSVLGLAPVCVSVNLLFYEDTTNVTLLCTMTPTNCRNNMPRTSDLGTPHTNLGATETTQPTAGLIVRVK